MADKEPIKIHIIFEWTGDCYSSCGVAYRDLDTAKEAVKSLPGFNRNNKYPKWDRVTSKIIVLMDGKIADNYQIEEMELF